jgi:hypothetical protein
MALVSGQLWPPNGRSNWIQPRIFMAAMPLDGVIIYQVFILKKFLIQTI